METLGGFTVCTLFEGFQCVFLVTFPTCELKHTLNEMPKCKCLLFSFCQTPPKKTNEKRLPQKKVTEHPHSRFHVAKRISIFHTFQEVLGRVMFCSDNCFSFCFLTNPNETIPSLLSNGKVSTKRGTW
mmetsp:Transcript_39582/g.46260  ORF Transcript_39582/g.46260 Transcript_39582/m.46260 type:complete len:128 (+) Transcript_39582:48-431(+)